MIASPSERQRAAFAALRDGPRVLLYQLSAAGAGALAQCEAALQAQAAREGGALRWAATEQERLIGRIPSFQRALRLHFARHDGARRFVESDGHAAALSRCDALQVAVLGETPRRVRIASAVMARLLPHWPFDDAVEPGEEPGVDPSTVMPTSQVTAALRRHPDQDTPVVMVNWLKFRDRAAYPPADAPASGQAAYYRYGKVAMLATHSLGAKLLFASRYRLVLIGNGGDPGLGLWDEVALMQYPGRATFGQMASLKRYRAALHHREAGLAEYGQGLAVTLPDPGFTWRR